MRPLRLRADWALPIDTAPIPDAAILIDQNGRIAAIGPEPEVPAPSDAESLELGRRILLPGLINTHTHLELTGFEARAPESSFREWILTIRRIKAERTAAEYLAAARQGIRDCWAGGVTTIADTGDSGSVVQALAELSGSGIVYHEVFGPAPADCDASFAAFAQRMEELRPLATGRVSLGASPHAPYTVSGPLYRRVAIWARNQGLPLAVHLAESRAETELVRAGAGPFAEAWRQRGIPLPDEPAQRLTPSPLPISLSPVSWLDHHGVLGPDTLCIHAVQLSADDCGILAGRGVAIAHCPRSNRRHGHGDAPLRELLHAGLRVGAGTDSVASVGRLDLFAELRAAMELAGLTAEQALELGTVGAARALGLERVTGTLTAGKWGDVIAVQPGPGLHPSVALPVVLASPQQVGLTVLGGRIVHRAAPLDPSRGDPI